MRHWGIYSSVIILAFLSFLDDTKAQEILSLDMAIEKTLANNYDIKLADNITRINKNNTSIYNTGYLPSVRGSGGIGYDNGDVRTDLGDDISRTYNNKLDYYWGLNISLRILDGKGRQYNLSQLKETYQLSNLQARQVVEGVLINLFYGYYEIARLQENVTALQQSLALSQRRRQRAQYAYEYGVGTKLEELNAQVAINNDSINLVNTILNLENAHRNLNTAMGEVNPVEYRVDTSVTYRADMRIDSLLASARTYNIRIMAAEKGIDISEYDEQILNANLLPKLDLSAGYNWAKDWYFAGDINNRRNQGMNTGLGVSWTFFDGGLTKIRKQNARINLENEKLNLDLVWLEVERDIRNTWADYQNARYILEAQESNLITSRRNLERSTEEFNLGQITSVEYRQAQLDLLNADLSYTQSRYNAKVLELQLLQLAGLLLY
jgi:outer membrane protein TolC